LSALQHESCEKVNQDLDDVSVTIKPVEKGHVNEELSLQAASVLPSISRNGDIQGGKSETNHQRGNATEHATVFEQQNVDKSRLEVSPTAGGADDPLLPPSTPPPLSQHQPHRVDGIREHSPAATHSSSFWQAIPGRAPLRYHHPSAPL
jgi:hypothetical protein